MIFDWNFWIALLGLTVLILRLKPWIDWGPLETQAPLSEILSEEKSQFPLVSIVIPCRNEADNIGILLESLEKLTYPQLEVLVVDDSSTDETVSLAKLYEGVTVISAGDKPEIWTGKNWPCHVGAMRARGEFVLFTDADTIHDPLSLQKSLNFLMSHKADMISAPPYHECRNWWEKALGFFHMLPLLITNYRGVPEQRRLFAIGQYLMFKKSSYWALGGHKAIAGSLVDDIDLASLCLKQKFSYHVFPSATLYSVQMFSNFQNFIKGWTRLMRLGLHRTRPAVMIELLLIFHLLISVFDARAYGIGFLGWALVYLAQNKIGAFNFLGIVMLPANILLFTLITLRAVGEKLMKQKITWRNRTYLQSALALIFLGFSSTGFAGTLQLQVTDLRNGNGALAISLFAEQNASSFPENSANAAKTYYVKLDGHKAVNINLGDLPPGIYAASLLHDENGNRKLDTSMGVPQEGFGFSNNPAVLFGAPSFEKCKFEIKAQPNVEKIKIKYLM